MFLNERLESKSDSSWRQKCFFFLWSTNDDDSALFKSTFPCRRHHKFVRTNENIWSQFHQRFTREFFVWKCFAQLLSNYSLCFVIFWQKLSADKWVPIFPVFNWPLVLWKKHFVFLKTTYSSRYSFIACNSRYA